jgi:hypothetical protein
MYGTVTYTCTWFLAIIDNRYVHVNKTYLLKATYAFNSSVEGDLRQRLCWQFYFFLLSY